MPVSPVSSRGAFTPSSLKYVVLSDQKASGTDGGGFNSGDWRTRTLNTEDYDGGGICTLAANQFTLEAGNYLIEAYAPAYFVNFHQARLYNVTGTASLVLGTSNLEPTSLGNGPTTYSIVIGAFTVAAAQALEIQHQCSTTRAGNGFGNASSFGVEVYTKVLIWQAG